MKINTIDIEAVITLAARLDAIKSWKVGQWHDVSFYSDARMRLEGKWALPAALH